MKMHFYCTCVGWPRYDVDAPGGLCDMINAARTITRRAFLRNVHRPDMDGCEAALGYYPFDKDSGLRMSNDWCVSYHKSKLHGQTVYFFKHSSIEHVFVPVGYRTPQTKGTTP